MIIRENINSPISIDDNGLEIYIDFNKPDAEKGRGDLRYSAYFQNKVEGQVLDTKNQRILIQPFQLAEGQKFDFDDLKNFFLSQNDYLLPYLVDTKFDWV